MASDVVVLVKSKGVDQTVSDLGKVEKAGGGIEKAFSGVGSALGGVAKIAGGFVLAQGIMKAPGALMDMAKAAAEDEAATMRLNTALQNLGGDIAGNTAKVNERIAAGQKLAFSDDDIRDSFQSLAAATGSTDEALVRQSAAMDLARGAGIPLATATKMLGKLNEENVEIFKKMGITLGENATEADALAAVQTKFGGQAKTFASSTAGAFEQLKIRLGEAKETIGAALLPVMAKVGQILADEVMPRLEQFANAVGPLLQKGFEFFKSDIVPALQEFGREVVRVFEEEVVPRLQNFAEAVLPLIKEGFATFKEDVLPALKEVGTVITEQLLPPLQTVANWFFENEEAMKAAAVGIATVLVVAFTAWAVSAGLAAVATLAAAAPVIAIVAAIGLLGAGIYLLITQWDTLTAKYPALQTATDGVKAAMEAFGNWITGTFVPAVQVIATTIGEVVTAVVGWFRDHWPQIMSIAGPIIDQLVLYIQTIATIVGEVFGLVVNLIQGDWSGAWENAKAIAGAFKEFVIESFNNLMEFLRGLGGVAWEVAKNIASNLEEPLKALGAAAVGWGADLVNGLWNGIKSLAGWIYGQAKAFAVGIYNSIKDGLGKIWPFSPSKAGIEIGEGLIHGIAVGIDNTLPILDTSVAQINNKLAPGLIVGGQIVSSAAYGGGGGGGEDFGHGAVRTINGITKQYDRAIDQWVPVVTQAVITDFAEGVTRAARTPGTFDVVAEAWLDVIETLTKTGIDHAAEWAEDYFAKTYYLATTPQGVGYLAQQGGQDTSFYYNQIGETMGYHGGLFPGMAGYSGGGGISSLQRKYIDRMGGLPSGGMTLQVNAVDAQSFRDWLNRGGGDQIAKWFGQRKSFA